MIINLADRRQRKRSDELLRLHNRLGWFLASNLCTARAAVDTRVSLDNVVAEIEADDATAILRGRAPVQFFWVNGIAERPIEPADKSPPRGGDIKIGGSLAGRVALCGGLVG